MVGDQRPRVASGFGLLENISQPVDKIMAILVVNEYLTAFDAANNNVVQGAGLVNTGLSGNDRKAINLILNSQVYILRALYIKIIKEYTGTGSIKKINYRVEKEKTSC